MTTVKFTSVDSPIKNGIYYDNHLSFEEAKNALINDDYFDEENDADDEIFLTHITVDATNITYERVDEKGKVWHLEDIKLEPETLYLSPEYKYAEKVYENHRNDFKKMKKELCLTNENIAEIIELTPDSVKTMTQPSRYLPSWADAMIYVWKRLKK
jgi:DNA-binding XRE family transcriptional regulator